MCRPWLVASTTARPLIVAENEPSKIALIELGDDEPSVIKRAVVPILLRGVELSKAAIVGPSGC